MKKFAFSITFAIAGGLIVAGVCVLNGVAYGLIGSGIAIAVVALIVAIELGKGHGSL